MTAVRPRQLGYFDLGIFVQLSMIMMIKIIDLVAILLLFNRIKSV